MAAFSELDVVARANALLDQGSFEVLYRSSRRDALLLGRGRLGGRAALIAVTNGAVKGGTLGKREAGLLARLVEEADRAGRRDRPILLIVFDTGGVRVEEGPAALAAVSAVGASLARLSLSGVRTISVISGPRGCFGALAVMAAVPDHVAMAANCHWGLTGPKLIGDVGGSRKRAREGFAATSAATRKRNRDAHVLFADDPQAARAEIVRFASASPGSLPSLAERIAISAKLTASLRRRLRRTGSRVSRAVPRRRRDLLRYSFRGLWQPSGRLRRCGLVETALGTLAGRPALSLVIGPQQSKGSGVGIEETALVTEMLARVTALPGERAAILVFLFCQGHIVDVTEERFGLPRALAECLRAMVAARLRGHPIIAVLGGGTYGAAYLSLAAPSHRILALRGTSIAPMSPEVLRAFQNLRGAKPGQEQEAQLAEMIPEIRIVESIIRLPRALREELESVRTASAAGA
jgi:malonate decarboxylase beta subunit